MKLRQGSHSRSLYLKFMSTCAKQECLDTVETVRNSDIVTNVKRLAHAVFAVCDPFRYTAEYAVMALGLTCLAYHSHSEIIRQALGPVLSNLDYLKATYVTNSVVQTALTYVDDLTNGCLLAIYAVNSATRAWISLSRTQKAAFIGIEGLLRAGRDFMTFHESSIRFEMGIRQLERLPAIEDRAEGLSKLFAPRRKVKSLEAAWNRLGISQATVDARLKILANWYEFHEPKEGYRYLFNLCRLKEEFEAQPTVEARLELCERLAQISRTSPFVRLSIILLLRNFDQLGLEQATFSQRITLCSKLLNDCTRLDELGFSLEYLGFAPHFDDCENAEQRRQLWEQLAQSGPWSKAVLANTLHLPLLTNLGIPEYLDFLERALLPLDRSSGHVISTLRNLETERKKAAAAYVATLMVELGLDPFPFNQSTTSDLVQIDSATAVILARSWPNPMLKPAFIEFLQSTPKLRALIDLLEQIEEVPESHIRLQLAQWLAYTSLVLYNASEEQIKDIEAQGLLPLICQYKSPQHRTALSKCLRNYIPIELDKRPAWQQLAWIPIASLHRRANEQTLLYLYQAVCAVKEFKDNRRLGHLIDCLNTISKTNYSKEDMTEVLSTLIAIISQAAPRKLKAKAGDARKMIDIKSDELLSISSILTCCGEAKLLECIRNGKKPTQYLADHFCDLFEIKDKELVQLNYAKTFGEFGNTQAIFTYLSKVQQLSEPDKTEVMAVLKDYVLGVLSGKYIQERYDEAHNPHLEALFAHSPDLKAIWMDNGKEEVIQGGASIALDYTSILTQKILRDRHLDPKSVPVLKSYLEGLDANTARQRLDSQNPLDELQRLAIDLCEKAIEPSAFIAQVLQLPCDLGVFRNDLNSLLPQSGYSSYVLTETDRPDKLLCIGTEIKGSCQAVDGDPYLNKCLVSYMMDGSIKANTLDVYNSMVARTITRMMANKKGRPRAVLLERAYSNVSDEVVPKALIDRARRKAEALKLPLVSKEVGEGPAYPKKLYFLGGRAPYTYTDAGGGVVKGDFSISGTHVLYMPKKEIRWKLKAQPREEWHRLLRFLRPLFRAMALPLR